MYLPVLSNSSTCDAVAPYAGPPALFERVKMATSPFELTATPDTSPTFMSAGSLRKLMLPSKGISGTGCCACATVRLTPDTTGTSRMAIASMRFTWASSGGILPPRALREGETFQQRFSLFERQAGVGDALSIHRRAAGHVVLAA